MIILIAGDTHTGKTLLAQKLLEKYKYPYLSIDHLKMGVIRSGQCKLPADSNDTELTNYLWPIVREMIKTCIENSQNMIIEGCYIPFGWEKDFTDEYVEQIKYVCLIFSQEYIKHSFQNILEYENVIEKRLSTDVTFEDVSKTNRYNLEQCISRKYNYILIDKNYQINIDDIIWIISSSSPFLKNILTYMYMSALLTCTCYPYLHAHVNIANMHM